MREIRILNPICKILRLPTQYTQLEAPPLHQIPPPKPKIRRLNFSSDTFILALFGPLWTEFAG